MGSIRPRILKDQAHVRRRSNHWGRCSGLDPTEDTERSPMRATITRTPAVAVGSIRPRILKVNFFIFTGTQSFVVAVGSIRPRILKDNRLSGAHPVT